FGLYIHADQDITPLWKIKYGLRFTGSFVKNKTYAGLEPRLSTRYMLNDKTSLKASYSRMKQYMHRVSSSTVALPTDLWYPVTANIAPQISDQVAVGYNVLFEKIGTSLTIEGYYKWLQNLIEYREGANLILNNDFENELLQGNGDAWGGEFLLQRNKGRFNGWISYTISWATRDFDELNGGRTFWAKYDRRHPVSVVGNFEISNRLTFSAVWVYQTGSRFTAQIGQYFMPNSTLTGLDIIPIYTDRNEVKMSSSHRLDLNLTIHARKKDKRFKSEWSFGCYNLYNYAQPYRVDIVATDNGLGYKYQQPGLFGFIPSIAYNFKF
ncbi:MAG: TonB-dependent receptor, partial [Flavobacteriales bacterium]|nr:TonB-dependent receptor [Flavobacteriales bacterium]